MKVYTDTLTADDLHACASEVNAEFPGCRIEVWDGGDERDEFLPLLMDARVRRFEKVLLHSAHSTRHGNPGGRGSRTLRRAASYAEWGWFLARLFERDPNARCASVHVYDGRDDFHAQTNGEFVPAGDARTRQAARELARQTRTPWVSAS